MNGYGYADGRRRWALAGIAALAALVLLVVGFSAGRASVPGVRPGTVNDYAGPGPNGPGPTRTVNGVPLGYAHTQAGAVAAATNFLMVVDGPLVTQPDKYRKAIDTLAAPEARSQQLSDAETTMTVLQQGAGMLAYAQQGRQVIFRAVPLAYHVDQYADSGTRVSIWAESITAADGALSLRETWTTSMVTVTWTGVDWRLARIEPPSASSEGPVPLTNQAPLLNRDLPAQLKSYRSYGYGATP
jgi:hypothetical protein